MTQFNEIIKSFRSGSKHLLGLVGGTLCDHVDGDLMILVNIPGFVREIQKEFCS